MNHVTPLESRTLLTIVWTNRGVKDGFDRMYGTNAQVARVLVDAAIADWNASITTPKSFKVKITAKDIEPKMRNSTTLGVTVGKSIRLDVDAAGGAWYFDPDLADNSDFPDVTNAYEAKADTMKRTDFFSVVLHELGHAVGFVSKDEPFVTELPRRNVKDIYHTSREDDLMSAYVEDGVRHLITPFDILHTKFGKTLINPTAPRMFDVS